MVGMYHHAQRRPERRARLFLRAPSAGIIETRRTTSRQEYTQQMPSVFECRAPARNRPSVSVVKRDEGRRASSGACDMRITIVGCGDAFGSGGRFNSATLVQAGAATCLLDCGATTMTAMNARGIDPDSIDLIVLTHLHGDHFGGVPFLLLDAQWIRGRTRPLTIVGPPGTRQRLHVAIEALFAGSSARTPWSFFWHVEELEPGDTTASCGFVISSALVVHPCGAPATAIRLEAGGKVFVHSGDTEWTDTLPQIAAGADLLFLECFALEQTPTHLDYQTLAERRGLFDAQHVVLTHMGPTMLDNLDVIDDSLFDIAEDGRVFELWQDGAVQEVAAEVRQARKPPRFAMK